MQFWRDNKSTISWEKKKIEINLPKINIVDSSPLKSSWELPKIKINWFQILLLILDGGMSMDEIKKVNDLIENNGLVVFYTNKMLDDYNDLI